LACAFGSHKPFFEPSIAYSAPKKPTQTTSGRYSAPTTGGILENFEKWLSCVIAALLCFPFVIESKIRKSLNAQEDLHHAKSDENRRKGA